MKGGVVVGRPEAGEEGAGEVSVGDARGVGGDDAPVRELNRLAVEPGEGVAGQEASKVLAKLLFRYADLGEVFRGVLQLLVEELCSLLVTVDLVGAVQDAGDVRGAEGAVVEGEGGGFAGAAVVAVALALGALVPLGLELSGAVEGEGAEDFECLVVKGAPPERGLARNGDGD